MADIQMDDGEILLIQDVPAWLSCGQTDSCLELRANVQRIYGKSRPRPMSWPSWLDGPDSELGERDAFGRRVRMSDHDAKRLCAYWDRDQSQLERYLPKLWQHLDLPPFEWDLVVKYYTIQRNYAPLGEVGLLIQKRDRLLATCCAVVELLERAAVVKGELPSNWDAACCGWPEYPIRDAIQLARYFERFAPWSYDFARDRRFCEDPMWYWRLREAIHSSLIAMKEQCPLRRTNLPNSSDIANKDFSDILLWLQKYASVLAETTAGYPRVINPSLSIVQTDGTPNRGKTNPPEHSPWIDAIEFGALLTLNGYVPSQKTKVHAKRTMTRYKRNWQAEPKPQSNNQKFRFRIATLQELRVSYPPEWNESGS